MSSEQEVHDQYHSSKIDDLEKSYLPEGFDGNVYNLSYKWLDIIPKPSGPYKIMEIGAYQGANVCSLMKTYAEHEGSEVHCVDPWFNYDGYKEYLEEQHTNYSKFLRNIALLTPKDIQKIYIHRDISQKVIPRFDDEIFDLIYIDGNHHRTYILEDAVHSFRKLKPGGWMIFDDMHDKEVAEDVNSFMNSYESSFSQALMAPWSHLLCQKK